MKITLSGLLACATLVFTAPAGAAGPAASSLPGHYYLQGVMETGSELLLKKDGTFEWMLSYGSMDEQASGEWRVDGDKLTLVAGNGGKEPQFRLFERVGRDCGFFREKLTKLLITWKEIVNRHNSLSPVDTIASH